jgi:hypothetical protein
VRVPEEKEESGITRTVVGGIGNELGGVLGWIGLD